MLSLDRSYHLLAFAGAFFVFLLASYVYKFFTHPLSKVPGPFLAKFTNARFLYHAWKGDLHLDHLRCHERYGSVYRSGPNRVVFNTLTATHTIYSADRSIRKSDGYTSHPWTRQRIPSLFNCVDPVWAALKKKTIRPATAQPALKLHHKSVEDNVEILVDMVKDGQPHDMSTLGFYYALDVISQSIFGERFQTMQDVNNRWMTTSLERGNKHMYLQLAWPDLFKRLGLFVDVELLTYPQLYQESKMFLDLCQKSLEAGKLGERESIFGLMKAELPKEVSNDELHVDAYSFMRGGGDMVAVTIAAALFYIRQSPQILQTLQEEIRAVFPGNQPPKIGPELESCAYLRACVDEALRMAPPGPGVFWRQSATPMTIDGLYLPPGIEFGVSIYSVHYNDAIFPEPKVFKPERMLGHSEESSKSREGLIPFLRGFRACPAQKLAYATILLPVARFVWEFQLEAEALKGKGEEEKIFPQVDVFGSSIQGPVISFRPRS